MDPDLIPDLVEKLKEVTLLVEHNSERGQVTMGGHWLMDEFHELVDRATVEINRPDLEIEVKGKKARTLTKRPA